MLFSLFTLIKDLVRNAMINRLFGPVALPKPQIHLRMRESKNWVRKKSECSQNIKNQITPWHVPARTIHIFLMCSPLRAIFFFFSLIEIILGEVTWVLFWRLYTGIITLPRILLWDTGVAHSIPGSGRSSGGGMAAHSSILGWKIPWMEKSGGLQSMQSQSQTRLNN